MRRLFFPIRIKIMVSVLFVVTAVVSVITFAMANMFHQDKRAYINDLTSIVALNTAQECNALLIGYQERLRVYARIIDRKQLSNTDKTALLKGFFEDFPSLVALSLYRDGVEVASVHDAHTLETGGLTAEDLSRDREARPLPLERVQAGEVFVENSTISESLPMLTLAVPYGGSDGTADAVIAAAVRLDDLLMLTSRSGVFGLFITDGEGTFLAHPDRARVTRKEGIDLHPAVESLDTRHSAEITLEYLRDDVETIGGYAPVRFGGLLAAAEIPKSAAYLASRDLLNRLLLIALGLLIVAALAGLYWSRRITRPVERLSDATRQIGRGEFEIEVAVDSRDEIGILAHSFNQMATELSGRDRALQEAQVQIVQSEKLAAVGQLGAGIAHEVKNPLAGILGCAQLSLRTAQDGTLLHKNLMLIEKETRRCKTIIENLMKFARQERSVLSPIEINEVVDDAIAIVNHQLELQFVKVKKDLAPDLPFVRANANQLQQVLMNLMINAQHAMEGNPGTVTLTTGLNAMNQIEVRVIDTGPGIPDQIREKIFEPFFTTKPTGKGTGLGLSVSYGIIKEHGGDIRPESEPDRGTTFIITLPIAEKAELPEALQARTA